MNNTTTIGNTNTTTNNINMYEMGFFCENVYNHYLNKDIVLFEFNRIKMLVFFLYVILNVIFCCLFCQMTITNTRVGKMVVYRFYHKVALVDTK